MSLDVAYRSAIIRYRFATGSAEFLSCARCGIYVGSHMEEEGLFYAVANLRYFLGGDECAQRVQSMDYSGEDSVARRARRAAR
jgi:hypothetical protein